MTTPTFVTLDQLRAHLNMDPSAGSPPSPDDAKLQVFLDTAHEMICDEIAHRHPADPAWIATIEAWGEGSPAAQPPKRIVLAVLELAAEFYRFRGDDESQERPNERGYLTPAIENLISKYKNRAFA